MLQEDLVALQILEVNQTTQRTWDASSELIV